MKPAPASKLTAADVELFGRFRISAETIEAAGVVRVTDAEARDLYGITGKGDMTGLLFRYFIPGGNGQRATCRLRRDYPEVEDAKPKNKYVCPFGDTRHLYFPPGAAELLADPQTAILFVESEKGCLALRDWSLRTGRPILPIGTGGSWGWRGRIGKATTSNGARVDEVGGLPDLACAEGRTCWILFDSDAATNPQVKRARAAFARELKKKRASAVAIVDLPAEPGINGPDDYLAAHSDGDLLRMFEQQVTEEQKVEVGSTRQDTSNAERFAEQHKDAVRYWHGRNKWLLWDRRWAEDQEGQITELAKRTAKSIYHEAATMPDAESVKSMAHWAERSLSRERIAAMLDLAKSHPRIRVTTDKLDRDQFLLNFENGTVDLRTGELREHRREDYITKMVRCNYLPDLVGPRWCYFVEQTFGELARWIQIALGYSVTGSTREKAVFVPWGPTDAGKTTFLSVLQHIFADYSAALQIDTLMWGRNPDNNTSADLADLRGARFVVTSETEEGQRLRESKLKRITQGMGVIKTARKYENPITFPETHKLWIDCNHQPLVRGTGDDIWNRLWPIPCTHRLAPGQKDAELKDKLLEEMEAIASWAVAGAVRWYAEGLGRPETVQQARTTWRDSMDLIGEFIADCCYEDRDESVGASELYTAFKTWAEKHGHEHPMTATTFGLRLFDRGFEKERANTGHVMYLGLKLRSFS